jgi:hypothetical protein
MDFYEMLHYELCVIYFSLWLMTAIASTHSLKKAVLHGEGSIII